MIGVSEALRDPKVIVGKTSTINVDNVAEELKAFGDKCKPFKGQIMFHSY